MFQFPQSGYEGIDLPQGIGFRERMIYNWQKDTFWQKRKKDTDGKNIGRNSGKRINIGIDVFDKI